MEDRCLCCGTVIPEGRLVCPACEEGCPPEVIKEIEKARKISQDIDNLIEALKALAEPVIKAFEELWEEFKESLSVWFDEKEIPKTPYFFKSKSRIYDKRPHKQHKIRNNCRKTRRKKQPDLFGNETDGLHKFESEESRK